MKQSDIKLIQELLERNKKRIKNNIPRFNGHFKMQSLLTQALGVARDWEQKLKYERSKFRQKSINAEKSLDESLKTSII